MPMHNIKYLKLLHIKEICKLNHCLDLVLYIVKWKVGLDLKKIKIFKIVQVQALWDSQIHKNFMLYMKEDYLMKYNKKQLNKMDLLILDILKMDIQLILK